MKKIKEYAGIIIIILIILGFVFYWYEYKPNKIRKNCFNNSQYMSASYQDTFYKNCVMGNGIKP